MVPVMQFLLNKHLQDLNPILAGWAEKMAPGSQNGSRQRSYTMLHYVTEGKGTLYLENRQYPVHAGQAFLILPGRSASYAADTEDPWAFRWVGFNGTLSHAFTQLPPVFDVPEGLLQNLLDFEENHEYLAYQLAGDLFMLYSTLIPDKTKERNYAQYVIDYVQASYMEKISVEDIAAQLGLCRRHLYQLFKKETGSTIQGYILKVRIQEAKRHIMQGYSIKEAAYLCGFNDATNFSKLFSREEGFSPKSWRNQVMANLDKLKTQKK